MTTFSNIDEYIAGFPQEVQPILKQVRETIQKVAPDAKETIKWAMPTYVLNKNLVHFAGHKNHIGLYPAPSGIEAFEKELADYKKSKGAIQFPLSKPIPYELIAKIVKFRVEENLRDAENV